MEHGPSQCTQENHQPTTEWDRVSQDSDSGRDREKEKGEQEIER